MVQLARSPVVGRFGLAFASVGLIDAHARRCGLRRARTADWIRVRVRVLTRARTRTRLRPGLERERRLLGADLLASDGERVRHEARSARKRVRRLDEAGDVDEHLHVDLVAQPARTGQRDFEY